MYKESLKLNSGTGVRSYPTMPQTDSCLAIQYNTIQYNTLQCNTIQCTCILGIFLF